MPQNHWILPEIWSFQSKCGGIRIKGRGTWSIFHLNIEHSWASTWFIQVYHASVRPDLLEFKSVKRKIQVPFKSLISWLPLNGFTWHFQRIFGHKKYRHLSFLLLNFKCIAVMNTALPKMYENATTYLSGKLTTCLLTHNSESVPLKHGHHMLENLGHFTQHRAGSTLKCPQVTTWSEVCNGKVYIWSTQHGWTLRGSRPSCSKVRI